MKPAPFDYVCAQTIGEACRALADAGGGATVIAGGQSLIPLLNLRLSQPFVLVDVSRIPELAGISGLPGGGVRIGAATRQANALSHPHLRKHLPLVGQALAHVGHLQTRSRGTIGGSLVLAEPAAELPAVAVALGAQLLAVSSQGERRIPAREFYLGPYMTKLSGDEVVVAVEFGGWPSGHVTICEEFARRPGDFALSGIVGALAAEGGKINRAGLAWLAMGPTPVRAIGAEEALIGSRLSEIDVDQVAEAALAATTPFDDQHASAEYRRTIGKRLFARGLRKAMKELEAA